MTCFYFLSVRAARAMKMACFCISSLLLVQQLVAQPVINSFTPASGPIGTKVTITCSGLTSAPADTIVYFGAAKASISAASGNTLTVTVPAGATYQPISLTKGGLTSFSTVPFVVTFPGAYPTFSDSSFDTKIDSSISYPLVSLGFADFDRDGKIDIVSSEGGATASGVSIYKNNGKSGKISLAARLWYPRTKADAFPAVLCMDVDGDGLLDIVAEDRGTQSILVYINTSTGGAMSFASPVSILINGGGGATFGMAGGDLNGDGKPDLVFGNTYGSVSVLTNASTTGNIAFSPATFNTPGFIGMPLVAISDIDGDNKPDIIVSPGSADKFNLDLKIIALQNTSSLSTTSFSPSVLLADIAGNFYNNGIAIGDLDGDGKSDIVATDSLNNLVFVFRNTSSPGNLSMATGISFPAGNSAVSITDLDGDGKPDLAVSGNTGISLLKNQSTSGTISFAPTAGFLPGYRTVANGMADIDGDGKPDLVVANASTLRLSIFRNKIGESLIAPTGANPITGDVTKTVTIDASVQQSNGVTYVQRHYDIEPANNPSTATAHIKLYFTQADFDNFNAFPGHGADLPTGPSDNAGKANLRIYQHHGFSTTSTPGSYSGGVVIINPGAGSINWNAGTQLWEVDFDVTGFSGFFISSQASSLPLKLLSFTGIAQGTSTLLKWSTASEINTSYFELQRSTDGSTFTPVTTIKAAGNSNTILSYQYTDTPGPRPVYYYRLKMSDIDGHSTNSDIVQIVITGNRSPLRVYPNPARNYITVEAPAANKARLRLLDMSGKLLQKADIPKNSLQTRLNLEGLAPGTYKIIWNDGTKTLVQSLLIL